MIVATATAIAIVMIVIVIVSVRARAVLASLRSRFSLVRRWPRRCPCCHSPHGRTTARARPQRTPTRNLTPVLLAFDLWPSFLTFARSFCSHARAHVRARAPCPCSPVRDAILPVPPLALVHYAVVRNDAAESASSAQHPGANPLRRLQRRA